MGYVRMPPGGERLWLENACLNLQPGSYPYFGTVSAADVSTEGAGEQEHAEMFIAEVERD
jgi:hypothetical protein